MITSTLIIIDYSTYSTHSTYSTLSPDNSKGISISLSIPTVQYKSWVVSKGLTHCKLVCTQNRRHYTMYVPSMNIGFGITLNCSYESPDHDDDDTIVMMMMMIIMMMMIVMMMMSMMGWWWSWWVWWVWWWWCWWWWWYWYWWWVWWCCWCYGDDVYEHKIHHPS